MSDHWVRSPLLNVNRACQSCHRASEEEMKSRVDAIQQRTYDLLQRGGVAIVALIDALKAAKEAGSPPERLEAARRLQRRSQWRLDFVAAENSMGFHAPQETARVLAEAIDYARQGELAARGLLPESAIDAVVATPSSLDAGVSDAGVSNDAGAKDAAVKAPRDGG